MKQFFKILGLSAIILFSFYYTEKMALLVSSKNHLMVTLREEALSKEVKFVNAEINGNSIVPGQNGRVLNIQKSYQKMKGFGTINDYYLIFDEIKPEVSVEKNKDKIIIKGNKNKMAVSFVIDNNESVKNFFLENKIAGTVVTHLDSFKIEDLDQINGESDKQNFSDMESILNKYKKNINICLVNELNKEICVKNKKYLVSQTVILNSSNISMIKPHVESGLIILIKEGAKVDDVNILMKQIEFKGLKIISLKEMINEAYKD